VVFGSFVFLKWGVDSGFKRFVLSLLPSVPVSGRVVGWCACACVCVCVCVYAQEGAIQYVAMSRKVQVSIENHLQLIGEDQFAVCKARTWYLLLPHSHSHSHLHSHFHSHSHSHFHSHSQPHSHTSVEYTYYFIVCYLLNASPSVQWAHCPIGIHTCTHTKATARALAHTPTRTRTFKYARTLTHLPALKYTHKHTHRVTHAHMHTFTHTFTRTHDPLPHTHGHTRAHTRTRTHIHVHTHTI